MIRCDRRGPTQSALDRTPQLGRHGRSASRFCRGAAVSAQSSGREIAVRDGEMAMRRGRGREETHRSAAPTWKCHGRAAWLRRCVDGRRSDWHLEG